MCFDALIQGDHDEKSLGRLLREELPSALKDGGVAALVVVVMVVAFGSSPVLAIGGAVAALALGVAGHQAVLLVGVAVFRLRTSHRTDRPETPST